MSDRECEPGVWYHQLGDHGGESLGRAAVDAAGDIYVTGQTAGDIDGQGERGGADVFIRKLSGADGSELWRVQFGSIGDDYVTAVAAGPGGALVVAGSCLADLAANEYREDRRCVQTLSAADGEPLWTHPLPAVGFWTWLDVSASGDIVVSAELGSDVIVRKLSPAGEMLWETLLEGSDGGKGVAFDSAGNVAVSHWRDLRVEYQFFTDGYVTLLSGNSGAELWTTVLDFDAADLPGKVDSDGGDRLVVSADAFDDIGTNSPRLAVLDRSDGAILWSLNTGDRSEVSACFAADGDIFSDDGLRTVQRRAGEDGAELWAIETDFGLMDVASTPSGDVVIVSGDSRLRTELLDGGDGSSQWQDSIQTDRRDVLNSVTIDAFGDVIVGGGTETNFERVAPNGRFDALVRKLSGVAGEPVWTRQFGNDESDEVFALCADSLGDVFVGGDTVADLTAERGQKDAFVSKLSGPSGTTLWSTQFGSEFDDAVEALAIDAEGDTVVTGFTELSRPDRAWVGSAYARKLSGIDGTLLWETRMDEGLSAPGVAVLPDGDIVTAWVSVQDEQQGVLRLSGIDGSVLWSVFLNGNPAFPDFPGYVRDLAVDPTGGIAVLAEKEPVSTLLKLSGEDGSELWEIATEAGPLAFHPDGYWIVANDEEVRRLSNTDGSTLGYTFLSFGEATNRDLAVGATGDVVLAGSTLANVAGTVTYRSTDGFVVKLMPFE